MIKFGPSGNSARFYEEGYSSTVSAAAWVADNGLDAYEYSFGRGVNIGSASAEAVGEAFRAAGVEISVHAPYYTNFATPDPEKGEKCFDYVLSSASAGRLMGAKRIVIHPATVGKETREVAFSRAKERFIRLADEISFAGYSDMLFCPETMGKINQIGTLEEVVELCEIADFFIPTIDFGHLNARTNGALKEKEDFLRVLDYASDKLGMEKMKHFHAHFSKIQFTKMGEVKHLTFTDEVFGPEFEPLAEALVERGLEPVVICESSGTQADDAAYMKRAYNRIYKKKNQ